MTENEPDITLLSERALLLRFGQHVDMNIQHRLWQLARQLRDDHQLTSALEDVVPGPGSLMVSLRPGASCTLATLTQCLETLWQQCDEAPGQARNIEIPVIYGGEAGPDLTSVAAHCKLSAQQVVAIHSAGCYQVVCIGFQPGFPYLNGLDPRLHCPRRDTPRARIQAGSVAIGGNQTGIYPATSPGGWHIIGHTQVTLFDATREPPCLLQAGDNIRFVVGQAP